MQVTQPSGRRERNKQVKLERIVAAAKELFAEQGVDDVTTQQIAERADIGAGTLFLYVKNKGELLLLVQNEHYRAALERGRRASADARTLVDAVVAVVEPVVACNRVQVENGRTYLREMVFGDPTEPNHADALTITGETERTIAELIAEHGGVDDDGAATLAHVVSAVLFVTMVSSADPDTSVADVVATIRAQVEAILPS
ncbi:TetR/AcrR family transcriptional regulator [Curtobacterium sp. MCSS17_016]|uniref:TetR/AcrR family transcriptional regulator n=1 Tax=Curtobacterium sp. MCSS17_016 TaxID=2175644 RepID=UPI001C64D88C|nr:TetR/AcrR family transcriptional regulator [Curtobacterium sp. MCSS17_016]WIE78949.1 TetR/AcrR family transcriptional regulator [Curtobacterium sp. MCSS17_016]